MSADYQEVYRYLDDLQKQAYDRGYKDGQSSVQIDESVAYNDGLNDAWECAKRIYDYQVPYELFGLDDGYGFISPLSSCETMTAAEAIAKIKEYEESKGKHKINVGDEVLNIFGDRGYVTSVGDVELCVLYPNGSTGHSSKSTYTKTGKHCKEIAELLRKVGENK